MSAFDRLSRMCGPQVPPELLALLGEHRAEVLNEAADVAVRYLARYADLDAVKAAGIIGPHTMAGAISDELHRLAAAPAVPVPDNTTGDETELARLRKELAADKDELDSLHRNTLPQLRREIQHHQDGKKRWRDRAEKAEARVAELERPSVEARRNEIRSTYTELISQAEQDRDHEGAATLTLQLRESEAKWAAEDKAGAR